MIRAHFRLALPLLTLTLLLPVPASAQASSMAAPSQPALLLRNPSLNQDHIAFRYADDIWTVGRQGGEAERLTSDGKVSEGPFYSPDGAWIAYSARLNGNTDAYVIPAAGGIPRRITWHPGGSGVVGWSPDGKDVLIFSMASSFRHYFKLFRVHADGSGLPEPLPLPSGFEGSFSPDGQSIAYQPFTKWDPAWKRYAGGQKRGRAKTPTTPTPSGSASLSTSSPTAPVPSHSFVTNLSRRKSGRSYPAQVPTPILI